LGEAKRRANDHQVRRGAASTGFTIPSQHEARPRACASPWIKA
jgi:hypothetical protein